MTYNVDLFEYANRSMPQNKRVLKQKQAVEHSRIALLPVSTGSAVVIQTCTLVTCHHLPNFTYYVQEHS